MAWSIAPPKHIHEVSFNPPFLILVAISDDQAVDTMAYLSYERGSYPAIEF